MRCKGCNRDIEVRWWTPEGCDAPVLEDLCNTCKGWSACTLRAISATEDDPVVYWPPKVGLSSDLMEAPYEAARHAGVYPVNADLGKHASVITGDKMFHKYGQEREDDNEEDAS